CDRYFRNIDRDTFDDVMRMMNSKLAFAVDHELGGNSDELLLVDLKFESMADFSPAGVVRQVPELNELWKQRTRFTGAGLEEIDARLSKQLRAIMRHEKFLQLEGSWRGLHYLVFQAETAADLQIKVLCWTKQELAYDLAYAKEFDLSMIFKRVYRDEFG